MSPLDYQTRRIRRRVFTLVATACLALLALAGCTASATPTPTQLQTAEAVLDATRRAMAEVESFAVRDVSYPENVPDHPDDPDFNRTIIEAQWKDADNLRAAFKPGFMDRAIDVIVVEGVAHSRWQGNEWGEHQATTFRGRDWDRIPDVRNAQLQGIATIDGTPAYHVMGETDTVQTTEVGTLHVVGTVELYVAADTHRLLEHRSRIGVVAATSASGTPELPSDAVWIGRRTYSQYNVDFSIEAPTVPATPRDPTPTPTRTPQP